MSNIDEFAGNQGQMRSALSAGLDVVDQDQTVTWTLYRRVVLPADGFVFWVRAVVLSPGALVNSSPANSFAANQVPGVQPAPTFEAQGSLHHTTVNRQDLDESFSVNRMIFTSKTPVNDLNEIAPDAMYLATTNGQRYSFSSRSMWYRQAGLYHYSGDAVYPALASQIIDYPSELNQRDVVVSNSLPIWLTLNQFFPVYPSLLVPDNIHPPYASVHIGEDDTVPMQAGTTKDSTGSLWQLAKDTVRITTYGVRKNTIMDWLEYVKEYTLANPGVLGVMNSPVPRDAKRGQTEISAIAQKKVIQIDASYYQARIQQLSRQLITKALLEDFIVPQLQETQ
jgi:hypothetical protein